MEVLARFTLNEEILKICLVKLCESCADFKDLDENLSNLFYFYSSEDKNENLRFIVLEALSKLNPILFSSIPACIFNLLLDDDDEIRNEMCRLINPANPFNLAQTLRNFIHLVGRECFLNFLKNYREKHPSTATRNLILFEKEVLNLFIDTEYLAIKF